MCSRSAMRGKRLSLLRNQDFCLHVSQTFSWYWSVGIKAHKLARFDLLHQWSRLTGCTLCWFHTFYFSAFQRCLNIVDCLKSKPAILYQLVNITEMLPNTVVHHNTKNKQIFNMYLDFFALYKKYSFVKLRNRGENQTLIIWGGAHLCI